MQKSKQTNSQIQRPSLPYKIPAVGLLSPAQKEKLDPWDCLEFFRIEALLRSAKLASIFSDTYQIGKDKFGARLMEEFSISKGWRILQGGHHSLLGIHSREFAEFDKEMPIRQSGVFNLDQLFTHPFFQETLKSPGTYLKKEITKYDPQYLYLEINLMNYSKDILATLEEMITNRQQQIRYPEKPETICDKNTKNSKWLKVSRPWHATKKPPTIRNVNVWLQYLRCYDLRHFDGHTFGSIAKEVYPPGGAGPRDRAEKAYVRVQRLIEAAEQNNWPPPSLS